MKDRMKEATMVVLKPTVSAALFCADSTTFTLACFINPPHILDMLRCM